VKTLLPLGLLAIVVGATATAGDIDIEKPLMSVDVDKFENRQNTGHTDLSRDQLQALSHWLEQHRSGWQGMITPGSSEPVQLGVNLRHSDGSATSLCVIARAGGGYYLRVSGPGKWAYQSLGGIFKSWAATRPISDQELAALQNLIGITR
jgi:hypothetical protein